MKLFKSDAVRLGAALLATSAVSFAQGLGVADDPFSQFLGGVWASIRADSGVIVGIGFILCFVGFMVGRSDGMAGIGKALFNIALFDVDVFQALFCGAGVLGSVGLVAWIQNHVGA